MRINHNIAAMNTYNKLTANNAATAKSLEKLSSGLKINRAGDNAAGLAISEKMRGQIRGLDTASTNAQDGISLIQTAEGALTEINNLLISMRELAIHAANEGFNDADQLAAELERARVVADDRLPVGTVRMGSVVRFAMDDAEPRTVRLVYPGEADIEKGFVSVLTPVGAALIGLTAGQAIDWTDRDGRTRRLHVIEVSVEDIAAAS